MAHQPYELPLLTMSDISWDRRIVRVSRPEGYRCGCCTKPSGTYVSAITGVELGHDSSLRKTAIINLPCGCAAMGLGWWRAAPDVLARLILVAEEKRP